MNSPKRFSQYINHPKISQEEWDDLLNTIAENTKFFVRRSGLSYRALAVTNGLHADTLLSLMNNKKLGVFTLYKVAKVLGIHISEFFIKEDEFANATTKRPLAEFTKKYRLTEEEQKVLVDIGKSIFKYKWQKNEELEQVISKVKKGTK